MTLIRSHVPHPIFSTEAPHHTSCRLQLQNKKLGTCTLAIPNRLLSFNQQNWHQPRIVDPIEQDHLFTSRMQVTMDDLRKSQIPFANRQIIHNGKTCSVMKYYVINFVSHAFLSVSRKVRPQPISPWSPSILLRLPSTVPALQTSINTREKLLSPRR